MFMYPVSVHGVAGLLQRLKTSPAVEQIDITRDRFTFGQIAWATVEHVAGQPRCPQRDGMPTPPSNMNQCEVGTTHFRGRG